MGAGFQRHIGCRAPRFFPGLTQRKHFRVRLPRLRVKAFADNLPRIVDDHAANIGFGLAWRPRAASRRARRIKCSSE